MRVFKISNSLLIGARDKQDAVQMLKNMLVETSMEEEPVPWNGVFEFTKREGDQTYYFAVSPANTNFKPISWDKYFLELVDVVSIKSKDPSTRVGAVLVNDQNAVVSIGFNGFPRELDDDKNLYLDREEKLKRIVHAEENAILNAARLGLSTLNTTLYIPFLPCNVCARSIIQAGVKRVVFREEDNDSLMARWKESFELSTTMLKDAGICMDSISTKSPEH
jgi:dCMP deaminase